MLRGPKRDRKSQTANLNGGRFSTTVNSSRFSLKTFISFFGGAMLNDTSVEDFCSYSGSMDSDLIPGRKMDSPSGRTVDGFGIPGSKDG